MLAGRESLIRLVGKRKRILSSSVLNSLLHDLPIPPPPPLLPEGGADGDTAEPSPSAKATASAVEVASDRAAGASSSGHDGRELEDRSYDSDWVSCPVCGSTVRGTDYAVNDHLDSCLRRGTKRKLTQCTLLQLDFFSKSSDKSCSNGAYYQNKYAGEKGSDVENEEENPNSYVSETDSNRTCGINEYLSESLLYSQANEAIQEIDNCVPLHNLNPEVPANIKIVDTESISVTTCFCINNINKPEKLASGHTGTVQTLETFIVGHRFHDRVELWPGASISILREPENANDHHAIKVLCTVSGSEWILGHLPRELAKYLSPLIENYDLKFKGFVTSLPKHPLDAIPINLVCENMVPCRGIKPTNIQVFESLWEHALRVVKYAKNFPPNKMRYQQNFHIMIQEVMNQHAHLFTDEEKSFLESFFSFSDDCQRIFIRLYTRKGPWFRMSNVHYPEVLDSEKAIKELQLAGYFSSFQSLGDPCKIDMMEVSDTLSITELREISNLTLRKKGLTGTKKQDLIDSLCSAYEDGICPFLLGMVSEKVGVCVKISSVAELLLWRVQRLFFLNGEQDLSAFLLVDLGLVKYPSYACNIFHPIFHGRNNLLAYEEAIEVAQIMDQSLDKNNVKMINRCIDISDRRISTSLEEISWSSSFGYQATFLSCFSASWVYSKVVTLGVSFLEHEHRYEDAVKLLKGLLQRCLHGGRRGYWTFRLSVDLEHIGLINESLSVAEEGIRDLWVRAGSKIALQRRVLRLGKPPRRWKIPNFAASVKKNIKEVHVKGRPLNSETGMKNRYYGYDGAQCGVEQLALQYYAGEGGWHGAHTETGIWMTIFGLLMWDVLFADVPDVFRTRFQTAPLDLDSDCFYVSRKDIIESQLWKIQDGMAEEILIISWESHVGTACRGVNWDNHSLSVLRAVVSCIGGRCLASICSLLAQDYRNWSSGMPDLLLWRFRGDDGNTGEAKLVEVKGPRDRLSEQQRAWMLFLMDSGFNTELCRVTPIVI